MFILYKDIKNFEIEASNGSKGRVRDFYFDDKTWEIRYLVVKSGFLFNTSESLITTAHLRTPDLKENKLTLTLTKEQIEDAANPEEDPPVSTQHERAVAKLQAEAIPPVAIGLPGVAYTPASRRASFLERMERIGSTMMSRIRHQIRTYEVWTRSPGIHLQHATTTSVPFLTSS